MEPISRLHASSSLSESFDSLPMDRQNAYDGEYEYWVVVKESGKRTEESSFEREHAKLTKAVLFLLFRRFCLTFIIYFDLQYSAASSIRRGQH